MNASYQAFDTTLTYSLQQQQPEEDKEQFYENQRINQSQLVRGQNLVPKLDLNSAAASQPASTLTNNVLNQKQT